MHRREQIGALWGALISAFRDGRFTELLRLTAPGTSCPKSAVPNGTVAPTLSAIALPEIVSPFGCAAGLRPKATTWSISARVPRTSISSCPQTDGSAKGKECETRTE